MASLQKGDEVRVFSRSRYQQRAPEGGWIGSVTRVGRKYATAEYETQDGQGDGVRTSRRTIEFDLASGNERGDRTQNGKCVRTPEQVEDGKRRADALDALKAWDIEFRLGRHHDVTTEQLEQLAAVVRTWDKKH